MSVTLRIPTSLGDLGNMIAGTAADKNVNVLPKAPSPDSVVPIEVLQLLKEIDAEYSWTPDWMQLEQTEYQPVFIYCNVGKGGKYHPIIQDIIKTKDACGRSCNPYVFTKDRYEVLQTKDGPDSFPIAFPSDASPLTITPGLWMNGHMSGVVKGRVYFVRSDLMKQLDKFKQHGILFDRVKTRVCIPYHIQWNDGDLGIRRSAYPTGTCLSEEGIQGYGVWMYVARKEYWDTFPFSNLERCGVSMYKERQGIPPREPFYLFRHWEIKNK